ncbi:hypothetical protein HA402_009829 [Bradysia odoriphaga]|nr:hypothetical protein HA402_009829 [Bradysia odoriphaga]
MDNYRPDEEEQITQSNGRIVMNVLAMLNNEATENQLTKQIAAVTGLPKKRVHHEVKQILDYGVTTGFLMKTRGSYSIPTWYQIDSGKKCEPCAPSVIEEDEAAASCGHASSSDEDVVVEVEVAGSCGGEVVEIGSSSSETSSDDGFYDGRGAEAAILSKFTRSKSESRRHAEDAGTSVDPVAYCVDDSDDEVMVVDVENDHLETPIIDLVLEVKLPEPGSKRKHSEKKLDDDEGTPSPPEMSPPEMSPPGKKRRYTR